MQNQDSSQTLKFDAETDDVKTTQPVIISESDLLATIDEVFVSNAHTLPVDEVFDNVPVMFP